jgi:hypothetical protein
VRSLEKKRQRSKSATTTIWISNKFIDINPGVLQIPLRVENIGSVHAEQLRGPIYKIDPFKEEQAEALHEINHHTDRPPRPLTQSAMGTNNEVY